MSAEVAIGVIDGPYDAAGLSKILARSPISLPTSLGDGTCGARAGSACAHGTFVIGLLGARRDALIPGLCPDRQLLHVPLFIDEFRPWSSVGELANAIRVAVAAGARLINLSLAILGGGAEDDRVLATALDHAEASGAVVVVAAGNQGRLAMGQLLSHPVTIPVVAVDAAGRLLPDCNFGPAIARRGVAALGQTLGYAPGGRTVLMSGTSVAAAVATGILAQAWSAHPDADGAEVRAAVAHLIPRHSSMPPMLDRDLLLAALEHTNAAALAAPSVSRSRTTNYAIPQGGIAMMKADGQPIPPGGSTDPAATRMPAVIPAQSPGGCACGSPGGVCTCNGNKGGQSGFVYAIGTVEAEYPNVAIEREMQAIAHALGVQTTPDADMPMKQTEDRTWQHAVFSADRKMTRYLARQLSWRLTIEDLPVFVLKPRNAEDFDDLIDCLARPKYPKAKPCKGQKADKDQSAVVEPPFGQPQDLDVVVGVAGSQTPDGIEVMMDQLFTMQPVPGLGEHFVQMADNWGLSDEDRAYNFLVARYEPTASNLAGIHKDYKLTGVPSFSSRLGGNGSRIVRAVFTYRRNGDNTALEQKYFVRVDVTHEFPFIVTTWHPYLERGDAS